MPSNSAPSWAEVPDRSSSLPTEPPPSQKKSFRRLFSSRRRIRISPYWLAVLTALFGFILRFAIDPWLGNQMPYITFLVAVALAGLFAGVGPAIVSTALGAVIAYWCFVPPRYQWGFRGVSDAAGFFSYLAAASAIVLLTRARKKAYDEAERRFQEQLAAEEKLRDAQTLFQLFMDNRPGFSYLRQRDGRYVYLNNTARRLLGQSRPAVAALPDAFSELQEQDEEAFKSNKPPQFINKIDFPDGERYWLTTKFAFLDREQQAFVGSVSMDITEQITAEEVAVERERLIAAAQMLATVAHEVNNPLAAVTQAVYLLGRQTLAPQAKQLAEIAQIELARLARITRLVLGFYKDDEHPIALNPCDLVNDVIETLSSRFANAKTSVAFDFEWEGTFALPSHQAREVVENILANAFESGASHIRVRVSRRKDWHSSARGGCRISVIDDGRGMSPEQQKRAFEPFFSTKNDRGSGLGLWISKATLLKNGGRISLRSTVESARHGTCVSVFLPDRLSPRAAPGIGKRKSVSSVSNRPSDLRPAAS